MGSSRPTMQMDSKNETQIRVLQLNDGENLEDNIFRLQNDWTIHFRLGPSLFGKTVHLFVNHPRNAEDPFKRNSYWKLPWKFESSSSQSDDTALYASLPLTRVGSFHYYFQCFKSDEITQGSGYLIVDPLLTYSANDDPLTLDCIQCQTYLSKSLGPFDQWEDRLMVTKESGYNMIHFTPIQELGKSQSSYSLKDHLKLNSDFSNSTHLYTMQDVAQLVEKMRKEWKVLSITDVVLNHTANESPWLSEHPECSFNLQNSPHLRPAFLLDRVLWVFNKEISIGKWTDQGLLPILDQEYQMELVRKYLIEHYLPKVNVHELFMVDVETILTEFKLKIEELKGPSGNDFDNTVCLKVIQDPEYRRMKSTIDMDLALKLYNIERSESTSEEGRIIVCCNALRQKLKKLNAAIYTETQIHINAGIENIIASMRYSRLDPHGPKIKEVSVENPLAFEYFTCPDLDLEASESMMYSVASSHLMAHNGWVMGDDPLRNFAEPDSNVYLRRELISWGDSVKLRYGKTFDDCPFLWNHMKSYVQQMAQIFHGLRLDNCHSTPLHVAEYLMDAAREVRENLYVIAELFTSNESVDNIFVNHLGINSLIREAMSANDAHELGRLVYRYGGEPVGAFIQPPLRPLTPAVAHAIFLDVTHDNPSPIDKRSVFDLLPSAALVSMACCATGSNRGYDELVPHHIHVVEEKRLYTSWKQESGSNTELCNNQFVDIKSGIVAGKRALNRLHQELGEQGFSQIYVDQVDQNIVAVTRHCPVSHKSVILVAHTSFEKPANPKETGSIPPLCVPGVVEEIILEARLLTRSAGCLKPWSPSPTHITGLAQYSLDVREHIQLYESDMVELNDTGDRSVQEVDFTSFPPGSIIAFRVALNSSARGAILKLRTCVTQFGYRMRSYSGTGIRPEGNDFMAIVSRLTLPSLNYTLFRCDTEERDEGFGGGAYNIPNYGELVYCGLQGIMSVLANIRQENDLGHPLCENLRQGDWLAGYTATRLSRNSSTKEIGIWFENVFSHFKDIPRYLIPCYFDTIITGAYSILLSAVWNQMSDFISDGSTFVKALALGSVALCGYVRSSPLPQLSPRLSPPLPPTNNGNGSTKENTCVTIAAGFPHFATGYMRNWGRDTFISLRGLLLIPERFEDARLIILAFGGCLRHGLIPNLLDRGFKARFNCRDAVWWWLQCIQDYCQMAPQGHALLNDIVTRMYPKDDSPPQEPGAHDQPLFEVIQEALQKHFQGVRFRERHAGPSIDQEMKELGFDNQIGVDPETGFVFGGNEYNCGTWMDKMGSSDLASNKGQPATPRDGSAVELVGLCYSALKWLSQIYKQGHYPYNSVQRKAISETVIITFEEWKDLIQENFERHFWVHPEPTPESELHPELINRRGIYKDSHKATQFWADFQLRPNAAVSMVVAPELFNPQNAWIALDNMEKILLGPLGMKTLDTSDWAYNGNYENSNNSTDRRVAHGFNYHQGPEWVWPIGYFLRAKLIFSQLLNKDPQRTIGFIKGVLSRHFALIQQSPWRGLPELTNQDGALCKGSCLIQAWSHACLLEVLYDMDQMANQDDHMHNGV